MTGGLDFTNLHRFAIEESTSGSGAGQRGMDVGAVRLVDTHVGAAPVPGDLNGDGLVNMTDYGILKSDFFSQVPTMTGADLSGDGKVNLQDFLYFKQDYLAANGNVIGLPVNVPEPASMVLICLAAGPAMLWLRMQRRGGTRVQK
jgi:hypothetical protein